MGRLPLKKEHVVKRTGTRHRVAALIIGGLVSAFVSAQPVSAELISVTFKDAVLPGGATTPLPFLLTNTDRIVYLRFSVPDFGRITAINSVDVTFRFYDDGDGAGESGGVLFAVRMPDPDLILGLVSASDLAGTTSGSPFVFTHSLTPGEVAAAFDTFTDNAAVRLRGQRTSGDVFVAGGTMVVDAELRPLAAPTPTPGGLVYLAAGLVGLALARARRRLRA
jgi:hypothetical protein